MAAHYEDQEIVFHDDAEPVSFVAGLLNVSEYKLFEIAYENWFCAEPTEKTIDGFFGSYLRSGVVPFWLRDTVRKTLWDYQNGDLTPNDFGIYPEYSSHAERRLGWILVGLFHLLVFMIVWGSANYQSSW